MVIGWFFTYIFLFEYTEFLLYVASLFGLNKLKICLGCWGVSVFGFIGCSYAIVIGCKILWVVVMI